MSRIDVVLSELKWKDIVYSFSNDVFGRPVVNSSGISLRSNLLRDPSCSDSEIISPIREELEELLDQVTRRLTA